jgi:hypothetical protein
MVVIKGIVETDLILSMPPMVCQAKALFQGISVTTT